MRARFFCLLIAVLLSASGVARADYIGVPIDSTIAPLNDGGGNAFAWGITVVPGYFYADEGPGRVLTAEFTRNTFTVTSTYALIYEIAFFAINPPPRAFSTITLLSSNVSPSLTYTVDDGIIFLEWTATGGYQFGDPLPQPMTATFAYTAPANPVPEPSSIALLGTGCVYGVSLMRRKHRHIQPNNPF